MDWEMRSLEEVGLVQHLNGHTVMTMIHAEGRQVLAFHRPDGKGGVESAQVHQGDPDFVRLAEIHAAIARDRPLPPNADMSIALFCRSPGRFAPVTPDDAAYILQGLKNRSTPTVSVQHGLARGRARAELEQAIGGVIGARDVLADSRVGQALVTAWMTQGRDRERGRVMFETILRESEKLTGSTDLDTMLKGSALRTRRRTEVRSLPRTSAGGAADAQFGCAIAVGVA